MDDTGEEPERKAKMPKVAKVKNKMPAPVQITAEQLLREAKERELELVQPPPKQKVSDEAELKHYRMRKRKGFEDDIRKNRTVMSNWLKYASWEEGQKEVQRARSVYERALDVDHRNITVWLKYAETEMRNRQVNHARNVWDRAVTILPRANQFWYKYTYMEEMLKNIAGARQVFERWMEWEPEEQAWHSYINFELRYKELDRARSIYERFVIVHPEVKNWIKYAKFEERNNYINSARRIYERAVEFFGDENVDEKLLISFAKFEEQQKEHDRARAIYKYALEHLPKERCDEIYKNYTIHEKKFGDRAGIEDVIVSKRKFKYEEEVLANPHNYDAWFDYLRLMESEQDADQIREVYERAIANIPPSKEKRHWRRYIYLWINYALYEELETEDMDRARQVYEACLQLIPHKKFTFAKVWLMYAHFEVRQKNLGQTRKILGVSLGKCPKDKLFRGYIDLEIQLREFERCRILYEKFLSFSPENCTTWMKYCELETILGDMDRARAIFELAIGQPKLDMPEVLWKAYIDFEIEQEEFDRTRQLYQRLLQRTHHVKVWISYAQFELSVDGPENVAWARDVYRRANKTFKQADEKEERLVSLESWKEFEYEYGDEASKVAVMKLMPDKVKKRRKVQTEAGTDAGWEEYYDYIFPDDETAKPNLMLLAIARRWKMQQELAESGGGEGEEREEGDGKEGQDVDEDKDVDESEDTREGIQRKEEGNRDDDKKEQLVREGEHSDSSTEDEEDEEKVRGARKNGKGERESSSGKSVQQKSGSSSSSSSSSSSESSEEDASKREKDDRNRNTQAKVVRDESRNQTERKKEVEDSDSSSSSSSESSSDGKGKGRELRNKRSSRDRKENGRHYGDNAIRGTVGRNENQSNTARTGRRAKRDQTESDSSSSSNASDHKRDSSSSSGSSSSSEEEERRDKSNESGGRQEESGSSSSEDDSRRGNTDRGRQKRRQQSDSSSSSSDDGRKRRRRSNRVK